MNNRTPLRRARGGSTTKLWETVAGSVQRLRDNHGHTLPENMARLRDKMNQYKREGYVALVSGKFCNKNTLKITEEAGRLIVALKRSRVPVYSNSRIFAKFNETANEQNMESLLQLLTRIKGRFMLTMFPLDMIEQYANDNGWKIHRVERTITASKTSRRKQEEWMVCNYENKQQAHLFDF